MLGVTDEGLGFLTPYESTQPDSAGLLQGSGAAHHGGWQVAAHVVTVGL